MEDQTDIPKDFIASENKRREELLSQLHEENEDRFQDYFDTGKSDAFNEWRELLRTHSWADEVIFDKSKVLPKEKRHSFNLEVETLFSKLNTKKNNLIDKQKFG